MEIHTCKENRMKPEFGCLILLLNYILLKSKHEIVKIVIPSKIIDIDVAILITSLMLANGSENGFHISQRGKHVSLLKKNFSLQFMWSAKP